MITPSEGLNTFGQKLLKKMGWKVGKGLEANKNEMGYKDSLLEKLNTTCNEAKIEVSEIEQKSSRAKGHKFVNQDSNNDSTESKTKKSRKEIIGEVEENDVLSFKNENKSKKKLKQPLDNNEVECKMKDKNEIHNENVPPKKQKKAKHKTSNDTEEHPNSDVPKKKKRKLLTENETEGEPEDTNVKCKNKSKTKKQKNATDVQGNPISNGDIPKQKKHKLSIKNETEGEAKIKNVIENEEIAKKKKKTKLKQDDTIAQENSVLKDDVPQIDLKSKEKSNRKNYDNANDSQENPVSNGDVPKKKKQKLLIGNEAESRPTVENGEAPKKKKKSKLQQEGTNIVEENPVLNGDVPQIGVDSSKKSKKKKQNVIVGCFDSAAPIDSNVNAQDALCTVDNAAESGECKDEMKKKEKRSKKKKQLEEVELDGPANNMEKEEREYDVKRKEKKSKLKKQLEEPQNVDVTNLGIRDSTNNIVEAVECANEAKREEKSSKDKAQTEELKTLEATNTNGVTADVEEVVECNLMLNVTTEPVKPKNIPERSSRKRRHNAAFGQVDQKRFPPNSYSIQYEKQFDEDGNVIFVKKEGQNIPSPEGQSSHIGSINEQNEMIGLPNVCSRQNKPVEEGVQLGFELARFKPPPRWFNKVENLTQAKKSYYQLIVGDVIVCFNNTNLHEIEGYSAPEERHRCVTLKT